VQKNGKEPPDLLQALLRITKGLILCYLYPKPKLISMGKGDRKTKRGKRFMGSYGKKRQRKSSTSFEEINSPKKQSTAKKSSAKKTTAKKSEPAKKATAKKSTATKSTAKKTTAKKATDAKKKAETKKKSDDKKTDEEE
jgi:ribosomal small subunit protein bTHX